MMPVCYKIYFFEKMCLLVHIAIYYLHDEIFEMSKCVFQLYLYKYLSNFVYVFEWNSFKLTV